MVFFLCPPSRPKSGGSALTDGFGPHPGIFRGLSVSFFSLSRVHCFFFGCRLSHLRPLFPGTFPTIVSGSLLDPAGFCVSRLCPVTHVEGLGDFPLVAPCFDP